MVTTALILLAITAAGGLLMAGLRFAGHDRPPSWLAMLHGLLAGSGLTLLLYAGLTQGLSTMRWGGIVLLVLAALGGLVLNLRYHDKQLPLPIGLMVGHAVLAVLGFLLLFFGAGA